MLRCAIASALTALLALPCAAHAQCDAGRPPGVEGTLRDTLPADLGAEVPTDGIVRLRYETRPPAPATVCVRAADQDGCIDGRASIVGDEVVWHASAPLAPFTDHVVTFADTVGGTGRLRFRTGRGPSAAAPRFTGLGAVLIAGDAEDPCDPGAVDLTVEFERAQRDPDEVHWPAIDIEYVILVTRGEGVAGPRVIDRARLQGSGSATDATAQRTVRIPSSLARGPVCLTMRALDPLGRADANTVERCVNPASGNYFAGCAAGPSAPSALSPWWIALAVAVLARRRFSATRDVC